MYPNKELWGQGLPTFALQDRCKKRESNAEPSRVCPRPAKLPMAFSWTLKLPLKMGLTPKIMVGDIPFLREF